MTTVKKNHRSDHHTNQFQKSVAQRLERCAEVREEAAYDDPCYDPDQHAEVERLKKTLRTTGLSQESLPRCISRLLSPDFADD
jgi:hypothetical protein